MDDIIDGVILSEKTKRPQKNKTQYKLDYTYENPPECVGDRIWDRFPTESSKAYQAFLVYRDMGSDRSLAKVAMILHNNMFGVSNKWDRPMMIPRTLMEWSKRLLWVRRVDAWDNFVYSQDEDKWAERQRVLRENQWSTSQELFKKSAEALEILDAERIEPRDLAAFIKVASQLGEQSRREPVSVSYLDLFLKKLPLQLREEVVALLMERNDTNTTEGQQDS